MKIRKYKLVLSLILCLALMPLSVVTAAGNSQLFDINTFDIAFDTGAGQIRVSGTIPAVGGNHSIALMDSGGNLLDMVLGLLPGSSPTIHLNHVPIPGNNYNLHLQPWVGGSSSTTFWGLANPPVSITTTSLSGAVGSGLVTPLATVTDVNLFFPAATWSLCPTSGPLPAGITLNANGTFSGTIAASAGPSYPIRVRLGSGASGLANSRYAYANITITVTGGGGGAGPALHGTRWRTDTGVIEAGVTGFPNTAHTAGITFADSSVLPLGLVNAGTTGTVTGGIGSWTSLPQAARPAFGLHQLNVIESLPGTLTPIPWNFQPPTIVSANSVTVAQNAPAGTINHNFATGGNPGSGFYPAATFSAVAALPAWLNLTPAGVLTNTGPVPPGPHTITIRRASGVASTPWAVYSAVHTFTINTQAAGATSTVTFNSQGGSAVSPRTVTTGTAIGAANFPANPTRANHTFLGWYTAVTGGTAFNANTVVNANITVHARWQANQPAGGGAGGGGAAGATPTPTPRPRITATPAPGSTVQLTRTDVTLPQSILAEVLPRNLHNSMFLLEEMHSLTVRVNNQVVSNVPTTVSVFVGDLNLTAQQRLMLRGFVFDPETETYELITGVFTADNQYFQFVFYGPGIIGVMFYVLPEQPVIADGTVPLLLFNIGQYRYYLNGAPMISDVAPFITGNRTMVPLRVVAEALGAVPEWDSQTRTAYIHRNGDVLRLPVGVALPDGMGMPEMRNNRILVPLRFVMENFGAVPYWDAANQQVRIYAE